jgi:hypothetical protein
MLSLYNKDDIPPNMINETINQRIELKIFSLNSINKNIITATTLIEDNK